MTVDEGMSVARGEQYASGAGVRNGYHEHSLFVFRVVEPDGTAVLLDPWILFRQMYRDTEAGLVPDQRGHRDGVEWTLPGYRLADWSAPHHPHERRPFGP